jgi:hypothetical protein
MVFSAIYFIIFLIPNNSLDVVRNVIEICLFRKFQMPGSNSLIVKTTSLKET